ncbi:HutD/Ves family protein [Trinickia sp.]|uniref:HutD/Ves family protein n=1 Tax=Trinickia sp. TaxID=2571163 RepID=UPI003F7E377A
MQPDIARPLWSAPVEPWRNGGGITRPLAARNGEWRVSLASIEQAGPYSRFKDMQRISVVVSGEGITLRHEDTTVELSPFIPAAYDGDREWSACLRKGGAQAVNVMARKDRYQAAIRFVAAPMVVPAGSTVVIVAIAHPASYSAAQTAVAGVVQRGFWLTLRDLPQPLRIAPVEADPHACVGNAIVLVSIAPIRNEHCH